MASFFRGHGVRAGEEKKGKEDGLEHGRIMDE
jgi:hypothetical protein